MNYNITVQHKTKKFQFTLPESTKVQALGTKLQEETTIPPSFQKIIFKGKKINILQNDTTLKDVFGKDTNVKLTLIGSTTNAVLSFTANKPILTKVSESEKDKKKSTTGWKHEKIIQKIKPEFEKTKSSSSFINGARDRNEPLPKSLSNIFNEDGKAVRMVFHVDKRELWIADQEETQKIPFDNIRNIIVEPIPQQDNFAALGVQNGTDPNKDVLWYFYIPLQFEKSIRYTLLGNLSFPFLHS